MGITFNEEASRFELEKDGLIAVAEFELEPGLMSVTHVVVPRPLQGSGVGSALAAEVIAHARRENIRVEPVCQFMQTYFVRHPETHDVLA
ncbi:N-acetyltransferase [bacterium]|nr:MAG: N-acetyltransferase [bacterium]